MRDSLFHIQCRHLSTHYTIWLITVMLATNNSYMIRIGYPFDAHCCHTGTAIKHPVPDRVVVICNFWHPGTLTLIHERQSARMSKIINDGVIRSGTGCFIAVPIWQQWASKGYAGTICKLEYLMVCLNWVGISSAVDDVFAACSICNSVSLSSTQSSRLTRGTRLSRQLRSQQPYIRNYTLQQKSTQNHNKCVRLEQKPR